MQANGPPPARPVGVDRMPIAPRRISNSPSQKQRTILKPVDISPQLSADQILAQKLTERMLASLSSDEALRDMIRRGLSLIDESDLKTATTAAETTSLPRTIVDDNSTSDMSDVTGVSRTSNESSLVSIGKKPRMDMWDPGFWTTVVEDSESEPEDDSESTILTLSSSDSNESHRDKQQQYSDSDSSDRILIHDYLGERSKASGSTLLLHPTRTASMSSESGGCLDMDTAVVSSTGTGKQLRSGKTKKPRNNRTVRFHEVCVRHYEQIMCDNPACRSGPSVGLGWNYRQKNPVTVAEWERRRSFARKPSLVLSRSKREDMIRSLGYSDREIAAVVRELSRIRYHRKQTLNNLGLEQIEMTIENAKRNVKKLILGPRE